MPCYLIRSTETFAAAGERTHERPLTRMDTSMLGQIGALGECTAAARPGTPKRLFAGMRAFVNRLQEVRKNDQ